MSGLDDIAAMYGGVGLTAQSTLGLGQASQAAQAAIGQQQARFNAEYQRMNNRHRFMLETYNAVASGRISITPSKPKTIREELQEEVNNWIK